MYISVNGVHDVDELRKRLAHTAYPIIGDKTAQALGSLAKSALGVFRFETDLDLSKLVEFNGISTFVIDDIERAELEISVLLGFFNNFVEHEQKHLILLGSEGELRKKPRFSEIKEKTIGFTLSVVPDTHSAISSLKSMVDTSFWKFIKSNSENIVGIMSSAEISNLRILKQSLLEFESVHNKLFEMELDDKKIEQFLNLFLVLNFAYKKGEINRSDLQKRSTDYMEIALKAQNKDREKEKLEILDDRFPSIDLFSGILDNEYLVSKICDGHHIDEYLERTALDVLGRTNASDNSEWRNLWYVYQNNDDVIEQSFFKLKSKFDKRQYTKPGEILHVFGIMLEMRILKLLSWSKSETLREFKRYVDDLYESGKISILHEDTHGPLRYGSAYGLGFTNREDPQFKSIWKYYAKISAKFQSEYQLAHLEELINDFENGGADFRDFISNHELQNSVSNVAILHKLDAEIFAKQILKMSAVDQYETFYALGNRYKSLGDSEIRVHEGKWLKKVVKHLKKLLNREKELTNIRVNKLISWNLVPHIPEPIKQK